MKTNPHLEAAKTIMDGALVRITNRMLDIEEQNEELTEELRRAHYLLDLAEKYIGCDDIETFLENVPSPAPGPAKFAFYTPAQNSTQEKQ